jgi:hypothetical protein
LRAVGAHDSFENGARFKFWRLNRRHLGYMDFGVANFSRFAAFFPAFDAFLRNKANLRFSSFVSSL